MWDRLLGTFVIVMGFVLIVVAALPAAAVQYEPLVVRDTDYPIPPGAVFVATNGNDSNSGTQTSPLRTISAAIDVASDGDTIVIREGTYREALPDLSKRLTLQPYPHERVWLKGSLVVTRWVVDGNMWRRENWRYEFCDDCYHPDNIDPAFPHAGLPDQVFIDGEPLTQVTSRSAVTTGAFYVDDAANLLFIGSNPGGRTVEASVRGTALKIWPGGRGTVVRGLGFAHYSPRAEDGHGGTVKANADNLTFENNVFAWSAVKGLVVFAQNATVRGNTFIYNGMMGLGAWQATGLMVTDNRFAFNNHEGFVRSGHVAGAAGAKLTATRNLTVTDNLFENNFATGLWLDINITNAIVTRNIFRDNRLHGIHYEISSNGIIASNIAKGNGVSGIALSNATHMQLYNNTLVGNAISLVVQDDRRVNDDPEEINLGNTWISGDTVFYNNLVCGNGGSQGVYIWARDFSGALDADEMLTASDFNGYCRRGASGPRQMVEWWRGASRAFYANLKEYRSATGRDLNSIMFDDNPADPFFAGAPSGNFALKPGSAARNAGRSLPRDVADAIGVAGASPPDLGALLLPGGDAVTPEE